MKIFVIDRPAGCALRPDLGALLGGAVADPGGLRVRLLPDSSLTPKGMPVFLPDFARGGGWEFRAVVAYRIGRLGKTISPRFAWRYIDGVTLGAFLRRCEDGALAAGGGALESGFDSSLTLGEFQPVAEALSCGFGADSFAVRSGELMVAETVALLSRYCTLRTGDIVIPSLCEASVPAEIGVRAEMRLNGVALRALRVK